MNRVTSLCKKYEITEGKCRDGDLSRLDHDNNPLFEMFSTGFDAHKVQEKYIDKGDIQ